MPNEALLFIICALLGGVGGVGAARRKRLWSIGDQVTHFVNMGAAAAAAAMVIWWYFDDTTGKLWGLLCGISLIVGLAGLPILEWAIDAGKRVITKRLEKHDDQRTS